MWEDVVDLHSVLPPGAFFESKAYRIDGDLIYGYARQTANSTYHAIVWQIPEPSGFSFLIPMAALTRRHRLRAK